MQGMQKRSSSSVKIHYPRFTQQELVDRLAKSIRNLGGSIPLRQAFLFGSYAKGNYTVSSDIDVLIVVERVEPDTYRKIYRIISLPRLELLLYSSSDYLEMRMRHPGTMDKLLEGAIRIADDS